MSDSTVRVLFLGNSAGAQKASKDLEQAMSSSFKSVQKNAENATSSIVSGFQSVAKTAAKTALITGGVISAGIAGGLIGATAEAIKFDAAMRNVNSIAKLSESQFQKVSKQVLQMSKSTGQGPTTLAKGLYDIYSSGIKGSGALNVLHQSAIAATAGLTDTATASQTIVVALKAFQIPAKDANKVASDLFETVNTGIVNFPQLATVFGQVTGLAPNLGASLQQATGAFAALTLKSGNYARAATQVQSIFGSLLKPSKDLSATIKDLGFENAQTALKSETLPVFLDKLRQKADENGTSIAKLFPNVRALSGFLGLTGKNAKAAADAINLNNQAYRDGNAQNHAFLEQQKSIAVQWNLTKAGIEAAAVPLGAVFFPALRKVLGEAGKFADFLTRLDAKKTITAKLAFAWDGVKGIALHLWKQLSDAITGESTGKVMVGSEMITFNKDTQGLASKFWDWFQAQVLSGGGQTQRVPVDPQVTFKTDPTLRDRFVQSFQGALANVNWSTVGAQVGVAIGASIHITTKAFDAFAATATAWANSHSGELANVGAVIGLKVIATLLDPSFWVSHWQLIAGIALTVIPEGKFAEIGGKLAQIAFRLFGKTAGRILIDAIEHLPGGEIASALLKMMGDAIATVAAKSVELTLGLVDAVIRGISRGFGRLGPLVRVILNTGLVAAIGGVIGAAVSAAGRLVSAVVAEIERLPGQIKNLGTGIATTIGNQIANVPGYLANGIASMGSTIVNEIVAAFTGLGSAVLGKIESEISGIHVPTPHVSIGHVGAGPVSIPYPTSISFNAEGGMIGGAGGLLKHPMIVAGEEAPAHPEFIIPTNPAYRGRATGLLQQAASALGVSAFREGGVLGAHLPREKHARKSPNRPLVRTDGAGAVRVKQPIGAAELAGVVSAANKALAGVTSAQQAVDDASSNYDLTSRSYDQVQENFLLDVPDDPSDPTNTSTHQVRNEADITQRLQQLSSLEGLKSHIVELIAAQKSAAEDAIAKLKSLIAELLSDIRKLQAQIAEAQKQMKAQNAAAAQHIKNENEAKGDAKKAQDAARIDRGKIATERLKPKKQQDKGKIAAWEADANKQDGSNNPTSVYRVAMGKAGDEHDAAHQSAQEAKASKANIDRLTTMIGNRTDRVKDYNDAISTQQASLQPPQLPANIRSAQLDLIDLQNEAASVNGTTGTNAAPASTTSSSATNAADLALLQQQLAAEEAMNQQLRNALGLGVAQSSVIGAFVGGAQGFAKGSLYVPDTGLAWVHRGEQIQTAAQSVGRDPGGNGGPPIHVNVTVADGMEWLKEFIRVEAVGASDQIAVAIGGSSDMRSRGLGF